MGHFDRGYLEKGEQVFVQTKSNQGLRVAKVTRLLSILEYTRV